LREREGKNLVNSRLLILCAWILLSSVLASAQNTATLTGQVIDPAGALVAGAKIKLANMLTHFEQEVLTDLDGGFGFSNVPFQSYRLIAEKPGFIVEQQSLILQSNVPVTVSVRLRLVQQVDTLEVSASEENSLIDPESTGTKNQLSVAGIARMPIAVGSRGLESVLLSFPGFAPNANGAIHPRGAHNQMTYVIDGMPISDQLTGSFANSVDPAIVQTVELFTANIPAEFGSKVSGVANITTRSGLGSGRKISGSTQWSAAQFDTLSNVTEFSGETKRLGFFGAVSLLKSNRFLDQVSLENFHNQGNSERTFLRTDFHASPKNIFRLNFMMGRSSFELANLRSQQAAGQDQKQLLRDFSTSMGWVHALNPRATFDTTVSYRTSVAQLFPSLGDTPVTAAQARHLSTLTLASRFNTVRGSHNVRGGADYQRFPVSENFSFGVTDPSFNDPDSQAFIPTLSAHDLSRGGDLFQFSEHRTGQLVSLFVQDNIRWKRFMFSTGFRFDDYRFLVIGHQLQPRLGLAFHIHETNTVLRTSYNRNYQTPPNENLLLSSSDEASVLVPANIREALGGALILIRPERQNVYEVGLQQSFGGHLSLDASYYHKDSHDQQDNDNFFNTGIIFPTTLQKIRVNGAELRTTLLQIRGFSGSLGLTHYHAVSTPPFTGGLFLGSTAIQLLNSGPFVIDHDQTLGLQGMLQYALKKNLWTSTSVRYDSGLVSNPSDPVKVAHDPDYRDLLPFVNLTSNPARVRPRTIMDFAIGYDVSREGRRRWDFQLQVSNLTNQTALFNFQSIFVGTRLVQPRTFGIKVRWYW
jgi:outer membrane cobalamin receptor